MAGNEPLSPPVPVFPDGGGIQSDAETAPLTGDERQRHFGWRLRTSDIVVMGLLGFTFLMIDLHPMYHSDVWGHLKFGKWILSHGRLPDREPFTPFADQRTAYVNFQWLSQSLFYLLYHAGEIVAGGDEIRRTEGGVEWLPTPLTLFVDLQKKALLPSEWVTLGHFSVGHLDKRIF